VIGKSTHAASDAPGCYEWYLRYLNNVVEGANNTGKGWLEFEIPGFGTAREAFDVPPNVLALETNEGGTLIGNYTQNTTLPPSAAQQKLIDQGLRLPTGAVHQCPCALAGRAHTLNASTDDLLDFSTVEDEWGGAYVERVKAVLNHTTAAARSAMSPVEARHFSPVNIFGLHAISCPFHSSGRRVHDASFPFPLQCPVPTDRMALCALQVGAVHTVRRRGGRVARVGAQLLGGLLGAARQQHDVLGALARPADRRLLARPCLLLPDGLEP
jgi:hypothetical protein